MMTFSDAVGNGLENFFSISGRMSRSAYWWFVLFFALVVGGVDGIVLMTLGSTSGTTTFINFLADISFWYLLIVPGIRRLHDIDKSSTTVLWGLIPVVGWIYLIYLYCQPSDPDENLFGLPKR